MKRNQAQLFSNLRPLIEIYDAELAEELNLIAVYWADEAFFTEFNEWILNNIKRDPEDNVAITIYSELTMKSYEVIKEAFANEISFTKKKNR